MKLYRVHFAEFNRIARMDTADALNVKNCIEAMEMNARTANITLKVSLFAVYSARQKIAQRTISVAYGDIQMWLLCKLALGLRRLRMPAISGINI